MDVAAQTMSAVPPGQPVVIKVKSHGFLVRGLYYIFIGWWFGLVWAILSWLMYATVIGAPIGAKMLNMVPGAISLKARDKRAEVVSQPSGYSVEQVKLRQHPWWVRVLYYPIGLVLSLFVILLAWLLCAFLITLPLGIILFNQVPAVASLSRQ